MDGDRQKKGTSTAHRMEVEKERKMKTGNIRRRKRMEKGEANEKKGVRQKKNK